MGSSSSKSVVKSLSEQITQLSSNISQKCNNLTDQRQNFNMFVGGDLVGNQISVSQFTDVDFKCAFSSNVQNDIQNQVLAQIKNLSKAQTLPLSLQRVKNDAETIIENRIRNELTLSNIQESYNQIVQGQKASIVVAGNATGNVIDISQGNKVFAGAVLDVLEKSGVFNTVKNVVDQVQQTRQVTPVIGEVVAGVSDTAIGVSGNIAQAMSGTTGIILMIVVGFIVLVLLGVVGWYVLGALFSDDAGADYEPERSQEYNQ